MASDGVNFVDEDDAGGVLFGLFEHIADAGGTDADEHFHEVGARNSKERHICLARDGARQQGLTSTGRAYQQGALGNASTEALEFLRVLQELDNFLQLFLGLVNAGHVVKGNPA